MAFTLTVVVIGGAVFLFFLGLYKEIFKKNNNFQKFRQETYTGQFGGNTQEHPLAYPQNNKEDWK